MNNSSSSFSENKDSSQKEGVNFSSGFSCLSIKAWKEKGISGKFILITTLGRGVLVVGSRDFQKESKLKKAKVWHPFYLFQEVSKRRKNLQAVPLMRIQQRAKNPCVIYM
jgi:hypothetical protein